MSLITLRRKRPEMNRDASPAADESPDPGGAAQAAEPSGQDAPNGSDKPRGATRFLYSTGDRPLEGYTIKRGLGRGGFGEVYFATSDAGKEVALKLIRRNLDIELRGVRHCLNLKHTNLIGLYDIRTDEVGDEWVVMEYVSGVSLDQVLDQHPNGLPAEEALAWIRGIAAGVSHLHENGIVHRDLKPGNLFLEGNQSILEGATVKIGDYGLSKFISCSRRSGQTESVGTVHYMAPEISGGRYGREIDTYALGIILYEMLTGHVPFEGESVGEVLMKHLTAEPDLSRVEQPYRSIVARALAKDPEARLKSAEELISLLPGSQKERNTPQDSAQLSPSAPVDDGVWRPVSTPPHKSTAPPREPLWQAMVDATDSARDSWRSWQAAPVAKGLMLLFIVAVGFFTVGIWGSVALVLSLVYFIYYIIWSLFLQDTFAAEPRDATATRVAPNGRPIVDRHSPVTTKPNANRTRLVSWREKAIKERRNRPLRVKVRSLIGSMIISMIVAVSFSFAVIGLTDPTGPNALLMTTFWSGTIITLGSWAVLTVNSISDAYFENESLPRRTLLLCAGLVIGFVAFNLSSNLGVPINSDMSIRYQDALINEMDWLDTGGFHIAGDYATVPRSASIIYFGLIFVLFRWWKHADYLRRKRVGLWSIAFLMGLVWLTSILAWYPQPTGFLLAGGIALATQIASPWLPASKRIELARKARVA